MTDADVPPMEEEFLRLVGEAATIRHYQGCAYTNLPESAASLWQWVCEEKEKAFDAGRLSVQNEGALSPDVRRFYAGDQGPIV